MQYSNSGAMGTPLVNLSGAGDYTVSQTVFKTTRPSTQVRIGPSVGSAIVMGNTFTHAVRVDVANLLKPQL